jgi:hypothetical protein
MKSLSLRPITARRACRRLLLLAGLLLLAPQAAAAAPSVTAPSLAPVHPGPHGYFEYTLKPGQVATATVALGDQGAPARYLLYVASAATSPVGGVAYGQPTSRPHGTAAWIAPSLSSLQVSGRRRLSFQVRVPDGTPSGDYVAAIAAQPPTAAAVAAKSTGHRSVSFLVTARTVIAVVIHVPGRASAAARFGQPRIWLQQRTRQVITIPIDDTGAVLMKPYLAGALTTCAGRPALLLDRQLDTFVPRTTIAYPWYVNGQALPAGCYRIAVALYQWRGGPRLAAYAGTLRVGPATATVRRPPAPRPASGRPHLPGWLIWALAAFALLMLLAGWLLLRSRRERRRLLQRLAEAELERLDPLPDHSRR